MACPWNPPPCEREGHFAQCLYSEHEPCCNVVEGTLAEEPIDLAALPALAVTCCGSWTDPSVSGPSPIVTG